MNDKQNKGLKIAISGKGGVGKTTIASLIARVLSRRGMRVFAIDADPVSNLGSALGISDKNLPKPISEMKDLIAQRTGATPGTFGGYFKMNPKVDDIPSTFSVTGTNGVKLLVMGTVEKGGSGCVCPESILLKNLVQELVFNENDSVVMDMEAGVEHLGRATAKGVDLLIIVVDGGTRSHFAARKIKNLAEDIGLNKIAVIGNRIKTMEEEEFIKNSLSDFEILGFLPDDEKIREFDREGLPPYPDLSTAPPSLFKIVEKLFSK